MNVYNIIGHYKSGGSAPKIQYLGFKNPESAAMSCVKSDTSLIGAWVEISNKESRYYLRRHIFPKEKTKNIKKTESCLSILIFCGLLLWVPFFFIENINHDWLWFVLIFQVIAFSLDAFSTVCGIVIIGEKIPFSSLRHYEENSIFRYFHKKFGNGAIFVTFVLEISAMVIFAGFLSIFIHDHVHWIFAISLSLAVAHLVASISNTFNRKLLKNIPKT